MSENEYNPLRAGWGGCVVLALLLSVVGAAVVHAQSVTYQVTFTGQWATTVTPDGVPSGAHFSPLIGAVHNDQVTFWSSGGTASAGIESMAEIGGTSTLKSEINASSHALSVIERSGTIGETATATVDITVSTTHPLVTLVTMIAPSPDWFVGVTGLSLRDSSNNWLASKTVDLFPYDAGTEEGTEFSLTNAATDPQGTITSLKGLGKFSNDPIAQLTFTLLAAPVITTASALEVDEGQTAVTTLTATDPDTPQADLMWTIPAGSAGGADADQFTLTSAGVLTFTTAPDYEAPADTDGGGTYEVTVQVSDGTTDVTADLLVTLLNVTELTTLSGPTTVTFAENGWGRVASFSASSEADRDDITWTLGGDDAAHFSLDNPAGALRFAPDAVAPAIFSAPPDFEAPADDDEDNIYELTVQASVGTMSESSAVTVTVTDVDEAGALSLSSTRPATGTELTATLTDPDGVTAGTAVWQWERNDGREGWLAISGATSASYTPVTADGDRYLRVRVTYTDSFGADKTAETIVPNVVIAHRLSALSVAGLTAVPHDDRVFYPAFDPDTLHYAARCSDSMTLSLTAQSTSTRVAVNGVQRPQGSPISLAGLAPESDIQIRLTGAGGGSTTYFVHCLDRERFPKLTTVKASGALEDLMIFATRKAGRPAWMIMMDNNGVPRLRYLVDDIVGAYFRAHPDESHPHARYSFEKAGTSYQQDGAEMVVLDRYFNVVADDIHVKSPFNNTNPHDQQITPSGDYVLMAYSRHQRDLRFLQTAFPDLTHEDGNALGSNDGVHDGAIQVRKPDGAVLFNWSSWDHMAIEDCVGSEFRRDYAHMDSLELVDGDIIAGFRHCSKILRIDGDTGDVIWRAGPSILTREQWEAGETLQADRGLAPLDFINDPRGGFSGQHGGHLTSEGNLLVYDNASHCEQPPGVPADAKGLTGCSGERARAVEYALDTANGELVFLREFIMPATDPPRISGGPGGHAEPLDNGDWLVSWSNTARQGIPMPNTAMHVDPSTGTTKLSMTRHLLSGQFAGTPNRTRVTVISPVALATRNQALTATFPASDHSAVFHTGATDSPQVVVAFNRPIVDFDATSPSLSVTGGTVASVSAHVVAGAPAHAYLVTFTPAGDGPLTFSLVANQACASGGICTADGTLLTEVPAAHPIPGPLVVFFGAASVDVAEGNSHTVFVFLVRNGRTDAPEIELAVQGGTASLDTDYSVPSSVRFGAADTVQSVSVAAHADTIVEGAETLILGVAAVLPAGVQVGSSATTTVTIADGTTAPIHFSSNSPEVAEGNAVQLTFRARLVGSPATPVTFTTDQTITLDISGTATPGVDFTVRAGGSTLSAPYTLTLPAGASAVTVTFTAIDDPDQEEAETIMIRVEYAGSTLGQQTLTIPASDQGVLTVTIARAQGAVTEGGEVLFTLSRDGAPTAALPVSVSVGESGAMLPTAPPPTTVTFLAGASSAPLRVPTNDDTVVEASSTVTVTVVAGAGYEPGIPSLASVVVRDNDTATFRVSATPATVMEGRFAAVPITVAIVEPAVTFAADQSLLLHLGGSATRDSDYTVASDHLTLSAGQREVTTTLTFLDDTVDEPEETIELTATHAGQVTAAAVVHIADNDPPRVSITAGRAREDEEAVEFTVRLSTADAQTVTVLATTADGTARAEADYTAVVDELLTFQPGETVQPLTIVVHDDSAVEADETFTVTLSAPQNATLAADATSATGTIENDDGRRTIGGGGGGGGGSRQPEPDPEPVGRLENPGPGSRQSGIGLLSGWVCDAEVVEVEINGAQRVAAAYSTDRADTAGVCGDRDNGFGLLFNWNLLGDGVHTVRALADGVVFAQATFTVTTLGEEFVTGAVGETALDDFPTVGEAIRLVWQEASQNFVLAPLDQGPPASPPSPPGGPVGTLENPGPASFQSGLGLLSGWVCEADVVELEINGGTRIAAAYGTARADTMSVCGDADNGFGLLFNWNLLGDGVHTVRALADSAEFGRATFTVTTLGVEFLQGMQGETVVEDFPSPGEAVRLIWQQANQNFVLAPLQ